MTELLSKRQLVALCSISMTQIDRLEKAGKWPKRIVLPGPAGTYRNSRVAWVKTEIIEHLAGLIAAHRSLQRE